MANPRKERLVAELAKAEEKLDALGRSLEPGLMRTQQAVAGQRARVFGLRAELLQMEIDAIVGRSEDSLAKRQVLTGELAGIMLRVKEAELSARAASKQATEDELPEMMRRLNEAHEMAEEASTLH